jgi:hypothetical protein
MTDYNNFIEVVKAGTDSDNPTRIVQIANASDLNPIQVDALPTTRFTRSTRRPMVTTQSARAAAPRIGATSAGLCRIKPIYRAR